jgi:hypothetical protein
LIIAKLKTIDNDSFYDVETAYVVRKDFFKNKKMLREKPQSILPPEGEGRSPTGNNPPSAFSGNQAPADTSLSADPAEKSSASPETPENSFYTQTFDDRIQEEAARYASPELWRKAVGRECFHSASVGKTVPKNKRPAARAVHSKPRSLSQNCNFGTGSYYILELRYALVSATVSPLCARKPSRKMEVRLPAAS